LRYLPGRRGDLFETFLICQVELRDDCCHGAVVPGRLAVATPDATIGARIGFVAAHAAQNRGRYRQPTDPSVVLAAALSPKGYRAVRSKRRPKHSLCGYVHGCVWVATLSAAFSRPLVRVPKRS
jgi:hypothetical protein